MHGSNALVVLLVAMAPWAPWPALAADTTVTETVTVTPGARPDAAARVNINSAPVKELMTLSGVGRRVAEKIVEYRDAHGPFKRPEEIRRVEGVGGGLWERNKDRIVVK